MTYLPRWVLDRCKPEKRQKKSKKKVIIIEPKDGNRHYDPEGRKRHRVEMANGIVFFSTWYQAPKFTKDGRLVEYWNREKK